MSSTKRIRGHYYITSVGPNDEVFIDTKNLTIDGDLVVLGNSTNVESTNTEIADNEIILNAGEIGAGVSGVTAGFHVDRGTAPHVYLRYNDSLDYWEATDDGSAWYPLNPTLTPTTFEVVDDLSPQLGGDLDVNGFEITSANDGDIVLDADGIGQVKINQELALQDQATDPLIEAGYSKLYSKAPGAGNSGVYVTNSSVEDELVSRRRALVYSLIL